MKPRFEPRSKLVIGALALALAERSGHLPEGADRPEPTVEGRARTDLDAVELALAELATALGVEPVIVNHDPAPPVT